ncbi:MAG: glycosyltransferase family 39 protein, partial [Chloroflexota bacterium]|nr:glycosyltransferase family 39 protein [Chloroflexota bacterium]
MTGISQVLQRPRLSIPERVRSIGGALRPHRLALAAILLLAAFLHFFQLDREGYSNLYYAATVRSMLTSWHNFFFASYDPGGFVTVDKPPLGFWIQAASAALFGFSGLSLLLPQALAGIASVGVLYRLVARTFGAAAGLVAALAMALMPVAVATNRNNTPDALLVLLLLLAAWAVVLATERGKLPWLLLGAVLVGLAFNVKMLQAYLAVPALWLLYLVAAPLRRRVRVAHLGVATIVLLAVSFSWAVAVDLTPAERRPYVGSSRTNSVVELILAYNGLGRLFG